MTCSWRLARQYAREASIFAVANARFWEAALLPIAVVVVISFASCMDLWIGQFISLSWWYVANFYSMAYAVQVLHPQTPPHALAYCSPFGGTCPMWTWSIVIALLEMGVNHLASAPHTAYAMGTTIYGLCGCVWLHAVLIPWHPVPANWRPHKVLRYASENRLLELPRRNPNQGLPAEETEARHGADAVAPRSAERMPALPPPFQHAHFQRRRAACVARGEPSGTCAAHVALSSAGYALCVTWWCAAGGCPISPSTQTRDSETRMRPLMAKPWHRTHPAVASYSNAARGRGLRQAESWHSFDNSRSVSSSEVLLESAGGEARILHSMTSQPPALPPTKQDDFSESTAKPQLQNVAKNISLANRRRYTRNTRKPSASVAAVSVTTPVALKANAPSLDVPVVDRLRLPIVPLTRAGTAERKANSRRFTNTSRRFTNTSAKTLLSISTPPHLQILDDTVKHQNYSQSKLLPPLLRIDPATPQKAPAPHAPHSEAQSGTPTSTSKESVRPIWAQEAIPPSAQAIAQEAALTSSGMHPPEKSRLDTEPEETGKNGAGSKPWAWVEVVLLSSAMMLLVCLADQGKVFEFSVPYLICYNMICLRAPDFLGHAVIAVLSDPSLQMPPAYATTAISFAYMGAMQAYLVFLSWVCQNMSCRHLFPRFHFVAQMYYYLFWYMMLMVFSPAGVEDLNFWVMVAMLNGNYLVSNSGVLQHIYAWMWCRSPPPDSPLKVLFDSKLAVQDQLADVVSLLIVPAVATSFHICTSLSVAQYPSSALFSLWQRFGALLLARLVSGLLIEELFRRRVDLLYKADAMELQLLPLDASHNRLRYLNDICVGPKLALEANRNVERCELYFAAIAVLCTFAVFQRGDVPTRYAFITFGS